MPQTSLQCGAALFNRGHFFDAHEVLEDLWRPARGRRRRFLQAIIQVAVALHHHTRGNRLGARSLLARSSRTLAQYPAAYAGLDLKPLRKSLAAWRQALAEDRPPPALPRLRLVKPVLESGLP